MVPSLRCTDLKIDPIMILRLSSFCIASFSKDRDKLVEYVNNTNDDLRNHVNPLPVGVFDSYQMILFVAAHSNRHMQQMNEVKADPNYPKN